MLELWSPTAPLSRSGKTRESQGSDCNGGHGVEVGTGKVRVCRGRSVHFDACNCLFHFSSVFYFRLNVYCIILCAIMGG